ncbi:hypothetical protein LCGC14_1404980, partial [marine sediment metagenome]
MHKIPCKCSLFCRQNGKDRKQAVSEGLVKE